MSAFKIIRFKTIKNSFSRMQGKLTHKITEENALEKYMNQLIDEVESVPENERVYYTEEEFWKRIEEREIEIYGHAI